MVNPATEALDRKLPVAGGGLYTKVHGVPGELYVPNITQDPETGLGTWTDGEIIRAFREGVDKDDKPLFAMMPYASCFSALSDADSAAIVAYMRTLAPVKNQVPERRLKFPLGLVVKIMPKPLTGPVTPPADQPLARGKYLVTVAGCAECHTPRNKRGQPIAALHMAGGNRIRLLDLPPGDPAILMPNLTSDKETGLGAWSDDEIRRAVQDGIRPDGTRLAPQGPSEIFHALAPEDMTAIIAYLRTVPAVRNPAAVRTSAAAKK